MALEQAPSQTRTVVDGEDVEWSVRVLESLACTPANEPRLLYLLALALAALDADTAAAAAKEPTHAALAEAYTAVRLGQFYTSLLRAYVHVGAFRWQVLAITPDALPEEPDDDDDDDNDDDA